MSRLLAYARPYAGWILLALLTAAAVYGCFAFHPFLVPNNDFYTFEDAARAEDPLAVKMVEDAAHHLGVAIAGLLNLVNPGAVILGGGLTRAGDHLLVPLREAVVRRTLVNSVAASEIRMSELGPRSTALGAATLVLASALADPRLFAYAEA